MPIPLPSLDDRAYADLVDEGRALIPNYAPDWTNHNPSDPGITLIEMFGYLTEMLLYRVNRVTDENKLAFLRLLNGPDWEQTLPLTEEIRQTVLTLRQPNRAITCGDFERLAEAADARVRRARCVPRRNLAIAAPDAADADKPGHVSIVVVPAQGVADVPALLTAVQAYLEPRRLLTTRVHVVEPRFLELRVRVTLNLRRDALKSDVEPRAVQRLQDFFDPLRGGIDGRGWDFGRPVYVSEVYQLLDTLDGVDYVTPSFPSGGGAPLDELVTSDAARLKRNDVPKRDKNGAPVSDFELVAVELKADELVRYQGAPGDLTLVSPVG